MIYTQEVENMCPVAQGVHHGAAPVPTEGKWVQNKEVKNISGFTHGVGWCAPQQGACKLTLNVKEGIIQEALVETIGCSGMTHSAAMAAEILPGLTVMEALNTDLVCDAINTAMRELFLQIVYGRTQLTMFPMERSNSLTVITKVAPSATIARGAAWRVILRKFFSVKNDAGLRSPKIPMMMTNAATVP